jgi:hypothetical protein
MAKASALETASIVEELIHGGQAASADVLVSGVGPRAAAGLEVTGDALPVTIDDLIVQETRNFDLSISAALEANIPVAGGLSGGYNQRVVVLERAAYKPIAVNEVKEQYGYAIRMAITVTKRTGSMKLTLPFLAASAELGEIEARWILKVHGLAGPKIDEVSLPPTELNVETFVLAKQSLEKLIGAVRDSSTKFSAQLIGVEKPRALVEGDFTKSVAKAYALGRIERGRSIKRAIEDVEPATEEFKDLVSDAYQDFAGINNPDETPAGEVVRKARSILADIKVEPR